PWAQLFTVIAKGFIKEFPREPFALWKDIEPEFKDLVGNMTNIDSKRQITARKALSHQWFADI
ncbi:hypothetical protein J3E72DRAFT_150044, partial [Bipolaris maydis]